MNSKESILLEYYPQGMEADVVYPEVYTSIEEEYEAIRNNVGIIDGAQFGIYNITGEDAVDFLDKLTTKEICYLNPGMTSECMMLDEKAHVLSVVYVQKFDNCYTVLTSPEEDSVVRDWMSKNIYGDVKIANMSKEYSLIFVEGRYAWKIVRDITGTDIESLLIRGIREVEVKNEKMWISRVSKSGEYGYAVMGRPEAVKAFASECFKLEEYNVKLCGSRSMDICMMETRQINLKYENYETGTIFELGQQWMMSYEKEDYIGYEELTNLFQQVKIRSAVGFVCEENSDIYANDEIYLEDQKVGKVIHSVYSPGLEKVIGLASLNDEIAVSGIDIVVKNKSDEIKAHTVSSPFLRPLSWDEAIE